MPIGYWKSSRFRRDVDSVLFDTMIEFVDPRSNPELGCVGTADTAPMEIWPPLLANGGGAQ